jgi:hypothetical protein
VQGDGAPGDAVMKKGLLQNAGLSLLGIAALLENGVIGRSAAPACLIQCRFS